MVYLRSNLSTLIQDAVTDCMCKGDGKVTDNNGLTILAEWIDSSREGYAVMRINIIENDVVKFSYVDYGTEIEAE